MNGFKKLLVFICFFFIIFTFLNFNDKDLLNKIDHSFIPENAKFMMKMVIKRKGLNDRVFLCKGMKKGMDKYLLVFFKARCSKR